MLLRIHDMFDTSLLHDDTRWYAVGQKQRGNGTVRQTVCTLMFALSSIRAELRYQSHPFRESKRTPDGVRFYQAGG